MEHGWYICGLTWNEDGWVLPVQPVVRGNIHAIFDGWCGILASNERSDVRQIHGPYQAAGRSLLQPLGLGVGLATTNAACPLALTSPSSCSPSSGSAPEFLAASASPGGPIAAVRTRLLHFDLHRTGKTTCSRGREVAKAVDMGRLFFRRRLPTKFKWKNMSGIDSSPSLFTHLQLMHPRGRMVRSFPINPSLSMTPTCALPDQPGCTWMNEGPSRTIHPDAARRCR